MYSFFLPGVLLSFLHYYSKTNAFQDYYYRDFTYGEIPPDAFPVAPDTYIGKVTLLDNNLVASIYTNQNRTVTYIYGKTDVSLNIRILCTTKSRHFYWEPVKLDNLDSAALADAIKGGFSNIFSINIYIGKVYRDEAWIVGSVVNSYAFGGLWAWNSNGGFERLKEFEILKYNSSYIDDEKESCSDEIIASTPETTTKVVEDDKRVRVYKSFFRIYSYREMVLL